MPTQTRSGAYRGQHKSKAARLSPQTVAAFKPPEAGKRLEINDTGCSGLRLRVSSAGAKTWSVVYRVSGKGADGRSRGEPCRASLGAYPLIDLSAARDLARIAMDDADRGVDYAKRLKAETEQRQRLAATNGRNPNCVEVAIEKYVERPFTRMPAKNKVAKEELEAWRARKQAGRDNASRWLKGVVVPKWRDRDIGSIRLADVNRLLDEVLAGRGEKAVIEVRKHVSGLFRWAMTQGDYGLEANPSSGLDRDERYVPRDTVLSRDQLKRVWDAAGDMGYPFREMFRLLILTGQRRSEVAELQAGWVEKRPDGSKLVRVPGVDHKSSKEHVYPLSKPTEVIVDALPRKNAGPYLLSGIHTKSPAGKAPVSGFSKAKSRLDKLIAERDRKVREEGSTVEPLPPFTVHDIRRSVATGMVEMGVSGEHVERVLGHVQGGVAGIYNRHDYFAEKLAALELWGEQFT